MQYNRFEKFKILRHYDKLKAVAEGYIVVPELLHVYASNLCNNNCWYCIMKEERRNQVMLPKVTLDKLVDDAVLYGIPTILFSGGGEPLTNPHSKETIAALQEKGITVGLNTNGVLLYDTEPDFVRVSLDACSSKTYKDMHGADTFDKVVENIQNYKGKELGLSFLITDVNKHEVVTFVEWANIRFKPSFIHIRPAFFKDASRFDYSHIKEIVERYPNTYLRTEKFDGYFSDRTYDKCRSTPMIGVLNADGRFSVCQDVFIKFGDYNNQSFYEAWFGAEHKRAIESIKLDECPRCVENGYNEIIQHCIMNDNLKVKIL